MGPCIPGSCASGAVEPYENTTPRMMRTCGVPGVHIGKFQVLFHLFEMIPAHITHVRTCLFLFSGLEPPETCGFGLVFELDFGIMALVLLPHQTSHSVSFSVLSQSRPASCLGPTSPSSAIWCYNNKHCASCSAKWSPLVQQGCA